MFSGWSRGVAEEDSEDVTGNDRERRRPISGRFQSAPDQTHSLEIARFCPYL